MIVLSGFDFFSHDKQAHEYEEEEEEKVDQFRGYVVHYSTSILSKASRTGKRVLAIAT
jgi:hypothetical protein